MSRMVRQFLGLLLLIVLVWMALVVWTKHQSTVLIQQALAHFQNLDAEPDEQEKLKEKKPENITEPEVQVAVRQVVLPPVPLPPVPEQPERLTPISQQVAASDADIVNQQRSAVSGVPERETTLTAQFSVKQDIDTSFEADSNPDNMSTAQPQPLVTTRDVYKQLSEDESLNIQLAWPGDRQERETVLAYLYQCVGAEFAVYDGQALTYLSPEQHRATSSWLRVAQGELSRQEKLWRINKAMPGTLVRIVPEQMDINLSSHIASTLTHSQQTLQALRGRYALRHNKLYLIDVIVNDVPVKGDWILYNPKSHC